LSKPFNLTHSNSLTRTFGDEWDTTDTVLVHDLDRRQPVAPGGLWGPTRGQAGGRGASFASASEIIGQHRVHPNVRRRFIASQGAMFTSDQERPFRKYSVRSQLRWRFFCL